MRMFLSWFVRIALLALIVGFGFTVVFPEWFDLKDRVVAERKQDAAKAAATARGELPTREADLKKARALELASDAKGLSEDIWISVDSGDAMSLWSHGTPEFQQHNPVADLEPRLRAVLDAMGARRDPADLASEPNYSDEYVLDTSSMPMFLDVETQYWGENAMCKRTLRFKQKGDRLEVDSVILYVLLYQGKEDRIPRSMMGPNVF
ncbi:MAG TPA: hypothetical protein VIT67_13870 [Povalibacter sp.]